VKRYLLTAADAIAAFVVVLGGKTIMSEVRVFRQQVRETVRENTPEEHEFGRVHGDTGILVGWAE
jgi:hypothetical protein